MRPATSTTRALWRSVVRTPSPTCSPTSCAPAPTRAALSLGVRGVRPNVHVTVAATTLLGLDDEPAELGGYGPIPASVARELAQEGTWRRILTDPTTGTVVETRPRHVPPRRRPHRHGRGPRRHVHVPRMSSAGLTVRHRPRRAVRPTPPGGRPDRRGEPARALQAPSPGQDARPLNRRAGRAHRGDALDEPGGHHVRQESGRRLDASWARTTDIGMRPLRRTSSPGPTDLGDPPW